jgi:hypothetical protein
MLNPTTALAKTTAINNAFAAIGHTDDTKMPRGAKLNTEPLAWNYHVASHLLRLAEAAKALAVREAVKASVMFDPAKSPLPVGTSNALVYAGDVVEIAVSVTTPATRLDVEAFITALIKAKVSPALLEKTRGACTVENRAPHKFTSGLVTKLAL